MNARRYFRRAPWERATTVAIGLGLAMLMQPWSLDVYGYGFTVLLAGVVGFSIAGKLPRDGTQPPRGN
jgi:hypothetical protein